MKLLISFFSFFVLNFSLYAMDNLKTMMSTQEDLTQALVANCSTESNTITKPLCVLNHEYKQGLDDAQINLFKTMNLSDDIRQLIMHARPLLLAWRNQNITELDLQKENCTALAKAINEGRNILYIRAQNSYKLFRPSPVFVQLTNFFMSSI